MLDPCHPLSGLAGRVLIVRWKWKLQTVSRTASRRTAGLYTELSSCHLRCTPAAKEENYDVMYFINNFHLTFKKRYASKLL